MVKSRYAGILIGLTGLIFTHSKGVDLSGLLNSHDPATLIRDGDTYWHFTTGDGIWSSVSKNLSHWESSNTTVFPIGDWPSWINSYVPDFAGHFWAPDIIFMNGMYYLYYSCSTFGSSRSAIGVVRTTSLNDPDWQDLGVVVSSNGSTSAINAIDPGLFRDDDGKIYMTYGSWFGGIGIIEIDTLTGWSNSSTTHLYGGDHQSIEASTIFKEGEYYYLVVNRGNCCQGINSTYYITAGRSANVMGPYEDFQTILQTEGKYIGPGHFGLLRESCGNFVSVHYYDGEDNGRPKLDILKLTFTDDWPELSRNFTFDDCPLGTEFTWYDDWHDEIRVYPNPASGSFSINTGSLKTSEIIKLTIFNQSGEEVYRADYLSTDGITVNCDLGIGIFYLRMNTGKKIITRKVVMHQ
jgi:arabinan endo-1,5-alpha-L-arabinosidase